METIRGNTVIFFEHHFRDLLIPIFMLVTILVLIVFINPYFHLFSFYGYCQSNALAIIAQFILHNKFQKLNNRKYMNQNYLYQL